MRGQCRKGGTGLIFLGPAVFLIKGFIVHGEQNNEFDKSDDRGYECPAEDQVQKALTHFAEIKFMRAETAKEKCQKRRGDSAFAVGRRLLSYSAIRAYFSFRFDGFATFAAEFFVQGFGGISYCIVHSLFSLVLYLPRNTTQYDPDEQAVFPNGLRRVVYSNASEKNNLTAFDAPAYFAGAHRKRFVVDRRIMDTQARQKAVIRHCMAL